MKDSYRVDGDVVEVIDYDASDNRSVSLRKYCDNIVDVFYVENELEELRHQRSGVLNNINYYFYMIKKLNRSRFWLAVKSLVIPFAINFFVDYVDLSFSGGFVNDSNVLIYVFSFFVCNYVLKMVGYKKKENKLRKNIGILNLDVEILDDLIRMRKDKLVELSVEGKRDDVVRGSSSDYISLDYKSKLISLKNDLLVYNKLSNRYDEFLGYYNAGCLSECLVDEFSDQEIDLINNYYKSRVKRK